jgi:hypothetical protein
MKVKDTFCISRATLDKLFDWKEHVSRTLKAAQEGQDDIMKVGGGEYLLRRLLKRAERLTREEMRLMSKLSPLIWTELLSGAAQAHLKMSAMRKKIVPLLLSPRVSARFQRENPELLHEYWQASCAHNHIMALASDWGHGFEWDLDTIPHTKKIELIFHEGYDDIKLSESYMTIFLWTASRASHILHMGRANWSCARIFPVVERSFKRIIHNATDQEQTFAACVYLNALASRLYMTPDEHEYESLKEEVERLIGYDRAAVLTELHGEEAVPRMMFEEVGSRRYDVMLHWIMLQRNMPLARLYTKAKREHPEDAHMFDSSKYFLEHLKENIALAKQQDNPLAGLIEDGVITNKEALILFATVAPNITDPPEGTDNMLFETLPMFAHVEKIEDLYLPEAVIKEVMPTKATTEQIVKHLSTDIAMSRSAPVVVKRSEPKVGRNDPCPCDSGKKYKKCCGREA